MARVSSFTNHFPLAPIAPLPSFDWEGLANRLPNSNYRNQLNSLLKNPDSQSFSQDLLRFGLDLRGEGDGELAAEVFSYLSGHETIAAEVRSEAGKQLDAILGKGGAGNRAEFLLGRLSRDATSSRAIVPMLAATMVGGVSKAFTMSRLLGRPAGLMTRGFGAQALSGAAGFGLEGLTFASLGRTLSPESPRRFGGDLTSAYLSLGILKLAGAGTEKMFKTGAPTAIRLSAQFGGLLAAHRLEASLGLRPHVAGDIAFTDALASMLSLTVGSHLGRSLLGPGFSKFAGEVELRGRDAGNPGKPFENLTALGLAPATSSSRLVQPVSDAFPAYNMLSVGKGRGGSKMRTEKNQSVPSKSDVSLQVNKESAVRQLIKDELLYVRNHSELFNLGVKLVQDFDSYNLNAREFGRKLVPFIQEGYLDSLGDIDFWMKIQDIAGFEDGRHAIFSSVQYDDNEVVRTAQLAKAQTIQGMDFKKGNTVHFDANGKLIPPIPKTKSKGNRGKGGVSGAGLALIGAGTSLATLLDAETAHAAVAELGSSLPFQAPNWIAAVGLGLGLLGMAFWKKGGVKDQVTPEQLDKIKRNPRQATISDVEALIADLTRNRHNPMRFSPLFWHLQQISSAFAPEFPEARRRARSFLLEGYVAKGDLKDVRVVEDAFALAVKNNQPLAHIIQIFGEFIESHPDRNVHERAVRAFVNSNQLLYDHTHKNLELAKKWDLPTRERHLAQALEDRDSGRLSECIAYYRAAAEAQDDPSILLSLYTHPHALVRMTYYMVLEKENEIQGDLKQFRKELTPLWESEQTLLQVDMASKDYNRILGALDVARIFARAGIRKAAFLEKQLLDLIESDQD